MENNKLTILELKQNIEAIRREKNRLLSQCNTIKTLSILCLCLLGFLSFGILFFILGGYMLRYREKDKKYPLQWVGGLLCILPVVLDIIGFILARYEVYVGSDDYYDYYDTPYYWYGLAIILIGSCGFYSGAIISLIFINSRNNAINTETDEKITAIEQEIIKLKMKLE